MIRTIIFSLFIFCLSANVQFAQAQQGKGRSGGDRPAITISGQVLDSESSNPLEFATISIYSKKDDKVVSGGITDESGKFSIESKPGPQYAIVEFIAYKATKIESIEINRETRSADLGIINLQADAEILNEVEVTAEKSSMQMSLDRRIFNVGKDLANRGGTALDILDNVPSVTVDIDGGIELRGSANVRMLIDGKPSGIIGVGGTNGLRTIPANMIERVEVITNPSAKYEAEGMSGIINIVLKKNQKSGFNGSVDLTAGYPYTAGIAANLNYRKDKFNFFINYGLMYRENPGSGFRNQDFLNSSDTLEISRQKRNHVRSGLSNTVRFGADYYFTEQSVLTTSFQYKTAEEDNSSTISYDDFLVNEDFQILNTIRTDAEVEQEDKIEYALTYTKKYKERNHEFVADFRYQDNRETEFSDLVEKYQSFQGQPDGINLNQRSNNAEGERKYILQADYTKPFSKESKIEMGVRGSLRQIRNDFIVEQYSVNDEVWLPLAGFTNDFIYDENIYAGYLIYGNKINRFSYQVGLRSEYTDVRTELVNSNEINPRDYLSLFPSAHVGYELSEGNSIQLSYSRRVRRPRFWDLNPFFTFSDPRNFFSGNPDLDPEFIDSYELGYMKIWEKGTLNSSIYYRQSKDVIQRQITVNPDGTTLRRPENLGSSEDFGLEVNGSFRPNKKVQVNANLNFFRSIIDGGSFGTADTYSSSARASSRFSLPKEIDAQVTLNYRAPRETTQGKRFAITSIDLAFSKEILKKNGTLTLSVKDLLNSRRRRGITDIVGYYSEEEFQWRSRQIILSLNYRINQKKKRGGRRGGGDQGGGGEF